MYKQNKDIDITYDFFEKYTNIKIDDDLSGIHTIIINNNDIIYLVFNQFSNFKSTDFKYITPFIKKYFTPSSLIQKISLNLILKYKINFNKCIALYYRGTDKK